MIAKLRSSDAMTLARELRGELDWILLRCLDPDRERRYGSVSQLANDLRNHLEGLPVVARPPTASYRLQKFAARHRLALAASGAVLVSLVFGISAALIGLATARDEAERARAQERVANAALRFLAEDLLGSASPADLGAQTPIGEVLGVAANALDEGKYANEPLVLATVRSAIGRMFYDLGLYEESIDNLRIAVDAWTLAEGEQTVNAVDESARLGMSLVLAGRSNEAEPILTQALEGQLRFHAGSDERIVYTASALGGLLEISGRVDEAIEVYERAVDGAAGELPDDHPAMLTLVNNIAVAYSYNERHDEAHAMFERALEACRAVMGEDHPDTIIATINAASSFDTLGNIDKADALYRSAFETANRVLGPEHPMTLTIANNLGYINERLGNIEAAETIYRDVLAKREQALGHGHYRTLNTLYNLAILLLRNDRPAEALPLFERDLAGRRELVARGELVANHRDIIDSLSRLADTLDALNRVAEAQTFRDEANSLKAGD